MWQYRLSVYATILLGILLLMPQAYAQTEAPGLKPQFSAQFKEWLKTNNAPQTATQQGLQVANGESSLPPPFQVGQPPQSSQSSQPPPLSQPSRPRMGAHMTRPAPPTSDQDYLDRQQQMRESIPPDSPEASADSQVAFKTLLKKNMPLTPEQVVKLRQQIDIAQRAASIPANIPPKPVSSTLMINLAPGSTPPAIRLAQGYVSSLVFVDSMGAPWPIAAFDIGNPKAVNIQWDGKSNILLVQAVSPYFDGNMVVRLVGLATPITLQLVTAQRVVDYRVDMHVSGIGPNTKDLPTGIDLPNSANQLLLGVLDGVAPPGSRELKVHGASSEAWLLGDKLYLRTRFNVLSPGWVGKMTSPDGMIAYEISKTSSVLISRYGEPAELKIEGL